MAITPVGSVAFGHNSGTGVSASANVPNGADTDLEVALGGSNFFDINDGFGPPSGTGWTLRFTVDRGVDDAHLRCWTRTAPAGAHTVTLAPIGNEEVWLAIRRLAGTDLANPIDDVDGATSANGNHTSPALTLATQAFLFGCAQAETGLGNSTYTPPAGFTELQDFSVAGAAMHATVAEDQVAGPGSVGPFTFVYASGAPGCALVVGIREASTATNLTAQNAAHDQVASEPTLTQVHILSPDSAVHAQVATEPTLTQVHVLEPDDATQVQVATEPSLTQLHILEPEDATQVQVAGEPTLTQVHVLEPADAFHAQTATDPVISGEGILGAETAVQLQVAGEPSLTQLHVLEPNDAVHAQVATSPTVLPPGVVIPELHGTVTVLGLAGTLRAGQLSGTITYGQLTGTIT